MSPVVRPSHGRVPTLRIRLLAAAAIYAIFVSLLVGIQMVSAADGTLALILFGCVISTLTGATILAKRPGHGLGRLMFGVGLTLATSQMAIIAVGIADPTGETLGPLRSAVSVAADLFGNLALVGVSVLLIIWFPDGRRTSRLGAVAESLLLSFVVGMTAGTLEPRIAEPFSGSFFLVLALAYAIAIVDLLLRYRRADPLRKAQIRWVLATAALSGGVMVLTFTVGDRIEFLWMLWICSMLLPAVGVVIALTRYHLYDIDRIVSRTIGYILISGVLFGAFVVVNLGLQNAIRDLTGETSPFTVAVSTLLVAVLFQPVRRRIQDAVDRRFDRARYDAQRTALAFAARLRDQMDVRSVISDLDATIDRAVAPSSRGVWLRAVARRASGDR